MKWPLFALRLLRRDWRCGELRILIVALVIAVSCMTAIGFFTDRMERAMERDAGDFLGGDVALSSPSEPSAVWLEKAQQLGLEQAQTLVFMSMLSTGESFQLSSVKAVTNNYPLRGKLEVADKSEQVEIVHEGPEAGSIWLAPRLMALMKVTIGDSVQLGAAKFIVAKSIIQEPDNAANWFSISPRAMINAEDIASAEVVQAGSRLQYRLLLSGSETAIAQFNRWVTPQLLESQQLLKPKDSRPVLQNVMGKASNYLNLTTLLSVILAGVAIAMAMRRYSHRHIKQVALMRCFGAVQSQIIKIYLLNLFLLGIVAIVIGCVFGFFAQYLLDIVFADLFGRSLPKASWQPGLSGMLAGFIVLYAFAVPPLLRLQMVPPLLVLSRILPNLPQRGMWVYVSAGILLGGVLIWHTGDIKLASYLLLGTLITVGTILLASYLLIRGSGLLRSKVGVSWRFGLANLARRWKSSSIQLLAFGLTIMVMMLLSIVRSDLLDAWEKQLPEQAPNYFVVNIAPYELAGVADFLKSKADQSPPLYPLVRGRLFLLNGDAILSQLPIDKRNDNSLRRELNLTWSAIMPEGNQLISGRWWLEHEHDQPYISVEQGVAERLGLKLGDQLGFRIGAETLVATILNIRSVDWTSFRPNFFVIFTPGMLEGFPATSMASFYLASEKSYIINEFITRYPSISVIDVSALLTQIRSILSQVTYALQFLFMFTLAAGLAVFFAAISATLDERRYECALLKTLGAKRSVVLTGVLAEFITLGFLAGLLGATGALICAYVLATQLLSIEFYFNGWMLLVGPLVGVLITALGGYLGTHRILRMPPINAILRD